MNDEFPSNPNVAVPPPEQQETEPVTIYGICSFWSTRRATATRPNKNGCIFQWRHQQRQLKQSNNKSCLVVFWTLYSIDRVFTRTGMVAR
jgi:hypothetical protein